MDPRQCLWIPQTDINTWIESIRVFTPICDVLQCSFICCFLSTVYNFIKFFMLAHKIRWDQQHLVRCLNCFTGYNRGCLTLLTGWCSWMDLTLVCHSRNQMKAKLTSCSLCNIVLLLIVVAFMQEKIQQCHMYEVF